MFLCSVGRSPAGQCTVTIKKKKISPPSSGVGLNLFSQGVLVPVRASPVRLNKRRKKKTDNPREGWEDGTPPPHRDFKERSVGERDF